MIKINLTKTFKKFYKNYIKSEYLNSEELLNFSSVFKLD